MSESKSDALGQLGDIRTCAITGAALAGMAVTFETLELWLATAVTVCSAAVWGRMAIRREPTETDADSRWLDAAHNLRHEGPEMKHTSGLHHTLDEALTATVTDIVDMATAPGHGFKSRIIAKGVASLKETIEDLRK